MDIITGYTGEAHITSAQDRAGNQGIVGAGSYILNVGNKLAAEVISASEIRIRDGVLSHQGCFGSIESGTYDSLTIANGTQGMLRHDLIVCRYEKNAGTNVESLTLVVLQGTSSASNPVDPTYNTGSIRSGDSPVDFPLYRVNVDGITIDSVENLADTTGSLSVIGVSPMGTSATTLTGAIAELNTGKLNKTWTKIGEQTGDNSVYFGPGAAYEDIFIAVRIGGVDYATVTFSVPKIIASEERIDLVNYYGTGNNGYVCVVLTNERVFLWRVFNGETDVKSTSRIVVYGR